MDYRELLKRYIRHVDAAEGSTFIPPPPPEGEPVAYGVLSLAELEELTRLEDEAYATPKPPRSAE